MPVIFVIILFAIPIFFNKTHSDINNLNIQISSNYEIYLEKLQSISASVDYQSKKKIIVLKSRDFIMKSNPKILIDNAYKIAELNYELCERYNQDPILILALQYYESRFDSLAISSAGAVGLCQIWPSTGRLLANGLGIQYHETILKNSRINVLMCVYYLNNLFSIYNDVRFVLAEYNGGPRNAYFLRIGSNDISSETKQYVNAVILLYNKLKDEFNT
jgi:hypothetical protein